MNMGRGKEKGNEKKVNKRIGVERKVKKLEGRK